MRKANIEKLKAAKDQAKLDHIAKEAQLKQELVKKEEEAAAAKKRKKKEDEAKVAAELAAQATPAS